MSAGVVKTSSSSPDQPGGVRRPGSARPGSDIVATVVLLAATVTTGLTAGVFTDWSNAIMPGLGDVDDRTFVEAFGALDSAITNPFFIGVEFTGALVLMAVATFLHRTPQRRSALVWIAAALVLYLVAFVVTIGVNEPLNEKLREAGDPSTAAEYAAARAQLDEAMWTTWNTVRAIASVLAFGCLAWALTRQRRDGAATGTAPR